MADIYELQRKWNLSLDKLRRMEKAGDLVVTETDSPGIAQIESTLRKKNPLTVMQLVRLIENPDWILDLRTGFDAATAQMAALGDARAERAPLEVALAAPRAAKGFSCDVEFLMEWMKAAIPVDRDVTHWFLGVRLVLGIYPPMRQKLYGEAVNAFAKVRRRVAFRDWFHSRQDLTIRSNGKPVTFYHRPNLIFDL